MTDHLWWDTHRILKLGSYGEDVEELKKALNKLMTDTPLSVTKSFDGKTAYKVRKFQHQFGLYVDGVAGSITQSTVFEKNFTFSIHKPPIVIQKSWTCWAASLESVFRATWSAGKIVNIEQLKKEYSSFLDDRGVISPPGLNKLLDDYKVYRYTIENNKTSMIKISLIQKHLNKKKEHILLIDHLMGGSINHVRVIYGVSINKGIPYLLVMDPLEGYKKVDFNFLQGSGNGWIAFAFKTPSELTQLPSDIVRMSELQTIRSKIATGD